MVPNEIPKGSETAELLKESLKAAPDGQAELNEKTQKILAEIIDAMVTKGQLKGPDIANAVTQLQQVINTFRALDGRLAKGKINQKEYDNAQKFLTKELEALSIDARDLAQIDLLLKQADERLGLMEQTTKLASQEEDSSEYNGLSHVTAMPKPAHAGDTAPKGTKAYRGPEEKGVPPPVKVETPVAAPSDSRNAAALVGTKAALPEDFRGEDSYEQIENIRYREHGEKIYNAIKLMAEGRTDDGIDTDNRTMWKRIRKNDLTVTFAEIVRARYEGTEIYKRNNGNKNPEQWILEAAQKATDPAPYRAFLSAASDLLTYLPEAEHTGVNAETQRKLEDENLPEAMKSASEFTDTYLFDRESYGPAVRLNIFQSLIFALKKKDRPTVSEDNWLDEVALTRRPGEVKNYGEVEIISQRAAYERLMKTGSPEAYLATLNHYLESGKEIINQLASMNKMKGMKLGFKENTAEPITDLSKAPTRAQVEAIHHGMMIEAAQQLKAYQDAEAARKVETTQRAGDVMGAGSVGAFGVVPTIPEGEPGYGVAGSLGVAVATDKNTSVSLEGQGLVSNTDTSAGPSVGVHYRKEDEPTGQSRNGGYSGADANAGVMLDNKYGEKEVIPSVGVSGRAYAGLYTDESKEWALETGVSGAVGTSGAYAGLDVGVSRNLGRAFEARLATFKEKNAAEIQALRDGVHNAIDDLKDKDGTPLNTAQKEARKNAADLYIDLLIQKCVMRKFTEFPIKFAGARVRGGIGIDLKTWQWGLIIDAAGKFAIVRPSTRRSRPTSRTETGSLSGTPTPSEGWEELDNDEHTLEIPNAVLYDNADDKAAAESRAEAAFQKEYTDRNKALENYATLSPAGDFTEIHLKNVRGLVRFYVDPRADMDGIVSPSAMLLNMDKDKPLNLQIRDLTDDQGNTVTEVFVSTNAATPQEIKESANAFVTWNQSGAAETAPKIVALTGKVDDNLYLETEVPAALKANTLKLRSLSASRAKEAVQEVRWEELARKQEKEFRGLFTEYNQEQRDTAVAVAEALKASGVNYNDLAYGNLGREGQTMTDDALNKKIADEWIKEAGTKPTKIANEDLIYLVRQELMVRTRPQNTEVPLEWNSVALNLVAGDAGQLYTEFMEKNKDNLKLNSFPEGTEFFIYVSSGGDMKVLQSYYDNKVNGPVVNPVEFNPEKPEETLKQLGINNPTDEQKNQVIAMAKTIKDLDWRDTPLNSLMRGETFEAAKDTWAGEILLSQTDNFYDGLKDPQKAPALKEAFVKNVKELLESSKKGDYGKTMVNGVPLLVKNTYQVALLQQCMNLVLGHNHTVVYEKPETQSVQVTAKREELKQTTIPEQSLSATVIEVGTRMPTFSTETYTTPKPPASEAGVDTENIKIPTGGGVLGPNTAGHAPEDL